ncbi:unnamed protein product [Clonostachys rhizophaga]|uniref:Uncharacterized protein n=1 Tax=Clonostachys rhizophaga TaxID=160324 RepID=A0A9N9YR93_9HYPO|nr:unnamed protein product [Clonostachys rhizophaga]
MANGAIQGFYSLFKAIRLAARAKSKVRNVMVGILLPRRGKSSGEKEPGSPSKDFTDQPDHWPKRDVTCRGNWEGSATGRRVLFSRLGTKVQNQTIVLRIARAGTNNKYFSPPATPK